MIKLINSIINSKLFLYAILISILIIWYKVDRNKNEKLDRLENNQIALTEQYSRQLQLTRQDFQRIYHKEDSIAKLVGIKPKQLETVIVNNYHYKDSTVVNVPYQKDSIKSDTLKFIAPLGCMSVEGYTTKSGIVFTGKEYNDIIHTFLYKVTNKKLSFRSKGKIGFDHSFLFIKWNNHIDVKTYSECKQDTIKVERNIKIINN